jgi:DNA-binding response OmpR family regulator
MKILIVDDDPGFCSPTSSDREQALPEGTGWNFLDDLRQIAHQIPVVLLTARPSSEVWVQGLTHVADDCMVKTIAQDEPVARLHAVLRRTYRSAQVHIQNLTVDPCLRGIQCEGQEIDLTPREFEILWTLAQASGRAVSSKELLKRLWGVDFAPSTNLVQVHVFHPRKKLEAGRTKMIDTVRGEGYRLKV